MDLYRYPRPEADTGIGFHFAPRRPAGVQDELDRWLPVLRSLGATWLVLRAGLEAPLPEPYVRQIVEAGIEPVVLAPVRPVRPIDRELLRPMLRAYASYGVRYVAIYHQPNRLAEWRPGDWVQADLVGRFLRLWTPVAAEIAGAGIVPVFPALVPGGDYWDTAFLAGALQSLATGPERALVDRMAIGVQNFAFNRPIDWGAGGSAVWRDARPYATPVDTQDHRGFRLVEWYDEIARQHAGASLPLIAIASGAVLGADDDPRWVPVDVHDHARRNVEMARQLTGGELPDSAFNLAFWTLTGGGSPAGERTAWFRGDGQHLPAADLLRQLPRQTRRTKTAKRLEAKLERIAKPIHHYLLFASGDDGLAAREWKAAEPYIRRFHPTCGFRLEEAVQAQHVTIVGAATIGAREEAVLRQAGCRIERLDAASPRELERRFARLVRAGKPFAEP